MSHDSVQLTIITPVYGCANCLNELVAGIYQSMEEIKCQSFEILLVDDRAPDNPWPQILELSKKHEEVKGIRLSRNFGQHAAIQAGLRAATGNWVIVMDCDLQDQPSEIPKLYYKALEGYDIVLAQRLVRKDSWFKSKSSKWFYSTLSYLTETEIDPSVANFGIYHQKVIAAILSMGDYVRFFPSMASWVGFQKTSIPIDHANRPSGKSSYNLKSLLKLGLSVIISFSDKPLRIVVKFGFIITSLVLFAALFTLIRFLYGGIEVLGYTSLILSIWFLGGIVISLLGIVGLYLGKSFDQVKNRPVFIISETTENENKSER